MSEHYYSSKPSARHERQRHEVVLRGMRLRLMTDAGVFSKGGVDYGSKVLVESLDIPADARILDVGCGYGPIGLSAAMMAPQGHVTMVDINERAVALSRENAELNGLRNVTVLQSDLFDEVKEGRFDVILTNPPIRAGKAVVHRIFEESFNMLKQNGSIWVVIQKKQGAPSAADKLEQVFGNVEEVTKDKGYRILRSRKEH